MVKVSVIIPVTRKDHLKKCLDSLDNQSFKDFEVVLVSSGKLDLKLGKKYKLIISKDPNPAYRRNIGEKKSKGEILALIDDDAYANKDWIKEGVEFLDNNEDFGVVGGPDLLSKDSRFKEKISDVLLSNKYLGSGVLAHQNYNKKKEVKDPSALALCNFFCRRKEFESVQGFNEKIGYGGEDTEFLYLLKRKGCRMMYLPSLFVYHKKRDFMIPYLKQRFKFRLNNGKILYVYPKLYLKNIKFLLFFVVGSLFFILLFLKPLIAFYAIILYLILLTIVSAPYIVKDVRYVVLLFAFGIQHITYYIGILMGLFNFVNYSKLRKIKRF